MKQKPFDLRKYISENTIQTGMHSINEASGYDVNIKDGKFQLDTHKTVITESKKTITEGYDTHTGLIYLGSVPFTKEAIEKLGAWFKRVKEPKLAKQFTVEPILRIDDGVNGGEVDVDEVQLHYLQQMAKKYSKSLASDKDFR